MSVVYFDRPTVIWMAMQCGIDPLSAMRFLDPEVTGGEIVALVELFKSTTPAREARKERERCASLS